MFTLLLCNPNMSISHLQHVHLHVFQGGSGSQGVGQGYDFVDALLNLTGESDGNNVVL
jgi:hypothetical protein